MRLIDTRFILIALISLLISACSPHPGSGVWQATSDNKQGISKLTISFEGKAEFVSTKKGNTVWHCFWTAYDKKTLNLDCSPSTDTEQKTTYFFIVNDEVAELQHETFTLATFKRLDENPTLEKK
jgi:hypothetical protein